MGRRRSTVRILRTTPRRERRTHEEQPICHIANKVMGSVQPRVEIVGLSEPIFMSEDQFIGGFIARAMGRNAELNGGYRRVPGLVAKNDSLIKWQLNLKVFGSMADRGPRETLKNLCGPASPVTRYLNQTDKLDRLIAAVAMTTTDGSEIFIDEGQFFDKVIIPFARGENPVAMAKRLFGLRRTNKHPVIKWRFDLDERIMDIPVRQLTALGDLLNRDWPDLKDILDSGRLSRLAAAVSA